MIGGLLETIRNGAHVVRRTNSFSGLAPRTFFVAMGAVVTLISAHAAFAQSYSATGGTVSDISVAGQQFRVHTFTTNGTLNVTGRIPNLEYLVVGGGGGGGRNLGPFNFGGGGGGGGGVLEGAFANVTAQSITVTVGMGGNGATTGMTGQNGQDSVLASTLGTVTGIGGGGGGGASFGGVANNGLAGGSGGGGGSFAGVAGTGTAGQGFGGGNNPNSAIGGGGSGGGGGGAGGPGLQTPDPTTQACNNGLVTDGGDGGPGRSSSITGSLRIFGGGGGGASAGRRAVCGNVGGNGGSGGGGTGGTMSGNPSGAPTTALQIPPTDGLASTGGGGGGARTTNGGDGGSGIVIVRYALPPAVGPTVELSGPDGVQAGPFTVTARFSEAVSGVSVGDFVIGNGTASRLVMVSPRVYTILVTPSTPGAEVTVSLPANVATAASGAMNAASAVLTIAGGALTEAQREEIRNIIVQQAVRDLRAELQTNRRITRNARDRFAEYSRCRNLRERDDLSPSALAELETECQTASRNQAPLGLAGDLNATAEMANLAGQISGTRGLGDARSRYFFADFDVTHFDGGDVTAFLTARVAWERLVSEDALFGYFIGANASHSNIDGSFSGDGTGYGLTAGAYFVDQLSENLFWDGFAAVSAGRNNLDISDATTQVDSDYDTYSYQVGLAVSGYRVYRAFDLRPELSLAYGHTEIGSVPLNVTTTSTLQEALDAGSVSLGRLSFEPEFLFPIATNSRVYDDTTLRLTPSLTCEYLKTNTSSKDCGGGLELEWNASSNDALQLFSLRIRHENIGGASRETIGLTFEKAF